MTPIEQIQENILKLESMLQAQLPEFPKLLRDIHCQLKKDDALVTLLSEEEIAIIVSGLSKQTSVVITTAAAKKAKGKSVKSMTVDDL